MRILLTNDDGITSPGLAVLRRILDPLGEVITIAPSFNNSAVARSITIDRSLGVEPVVFGAGYAGWAVNGTPCDCVRIALLGQLSLPPQGSCKWTKSANLPSLAVQERNALNHSASSPFRRMSTRGFR